MQIEEEREPQRGDEEDTVENSVTPQSEFEKPFIEDPDLDENTFSNLLNDLFQAPSDKVGLIISADRRDARGPEGTRRLPGRRARERPELAGVARRREAARAVDRARDRGRRRRARLLAGFG